MKNCSLCGRETSIMVAMVSPTDKKSVIVCENCDLIPAMVIPADEHERKMTQTEASRVVQEYKRNQGRA